MLLQTSEMESRILDSSDCDSANIVIGVSELDANRGSTTSKDL
jgi:hypothetical protein